MKLAIPQSLANNPVHILTIPTVVAKSYADMLQGPLFLTGDFPNVDELYETFHDAGLSVDSSVTIQLTQDDAALLYWSIEYHNGGGVLPPEAAEGNTNGTDK
jgi:hypothetical protein